MVSLERHFISNTQNNCAQYLWWVFKSNHVKWARSFSTFLGALILQLKTKQNTTQVKKNQCQKTETTIFRIRINNLKMGPRAYIGHKLQIWKWEKWGLVFQSQVSQKGYLNSWISHTTEFQDSLPSGIIF